MFRTFSPKFGAECSECNFCLHISALSNSNVTEFEMEANTFQFQSFIIFLNILSLVFDLKKWGLSNAKATLIAAMY